MHFKRLEITQSYNLSINSIDLILCYFFNRKMRPRGYLNLHTIVHLRKSKHGFSKIKQKDELIKNNIFPYNFVPTETDNNERVIVNIVLDKMFNSVNYRDFNKQRTTTSLGGNNFINANALWANNKYTGYTLSYSCLNFS